MGWKAVGIIMSALLVAVSVALSALIWTDQSNKTEAITMTPTVATPPIIVTPIGRFVGVVTTSITYGNTYISYRSIPFAKSPIGELRFKRPQPLDNIVTSRQVNSDKYQQSCLSATRLTADPNYGEDCLYLNVYVPGNVEIGHIARTLPVMIWIHGGGFVAGTTFPEPEKLVLRGNVIVVTVNYRLGPFGFLTTNDDELPSNNGLWDQYMAIKWVHDYIHYFHGDNSSITVFGESSGAVSAALHTISPVSAGLFHKAVLQSGGATSLISRDAEVRAEEFASKIGCLNYKSTSDLRKCLQQANVFDILLNSRPSAFNISSAQQQIDFIWMPVVDGVFIPDEPLVLLSNVTYMKRIGAFDKDFLIGVLNNEGALIVQNFLNPISLSRISDTNFFKDLVDYLLYARYGPGNINSQDLMDAIYTFYVGFASSPQSPESVLDLAADLTFVIPAIEMALLVSNCRETVVPACLLIMNNTQFSSCTKSSSKTYLYHFDYCPEKDSCSAQCMHHGADIAYAFPRDTFTDPVRQKLSDTFVDLLTTFSKNSNPGTVVSSGWPEFNIQTQNYLRLDYNPSVRRYLYDYRVNFWLQTVTGLLKELK